MTQREVQGGRSDQSVVPATCGIVIPCHNGARYLEETVAAVRRQQAATWSMVIVDDRSTDDSAAIAHRLAAEDPRIVVLRLPRNRGVSGARNAGAELLRDHHALYFLDADDLPHPLALHHALRHLAEHPALSAVYLGKRHIDQDGAVVGGDGTWPWRRCVATRFAIRYLPPTDRRTPFESILLAAAMIPSTTIVRSKAFWLVGGFDEQMSQGCEDTDLFLRLALAGPIAHLAPSLVDYRQHPTQATKSVDFAARYAELMSKWRQRADSDPDHGGEISDAFWFRDHRFVPVMSLVEAFRAARRGQVVEALRKLLLAARTYSPRRPPSSLAR